MILMLVLVPVLVLVLVLQLASWGYYHSCNESLFLHQTKKSGHPAGRRDRFQVEQSWAAECVVLMLVMLVPVLVPVLVLLAK